jgi:hypothetical protein
MRKLQNFNVGGGGDFYQQNCLENATDALAKAASLEDKKKLTHLSLKWNIEA